MGNIQSQSIRSSVLIVFGFAIGALNMLVIAPKILGPEMLGLTRIITDAGITLATLASFGTIPVIYKFFPFYSGYLPPKKNDLPFFSLMICILGFVTVCIVGYLCKDIIIRKYSERAPLFVEYSYLVYPFCFFMLAFMWLESFGWSLRKSVLTNGLKEIVPRILFTVLTLLYGWQIISNSNYLLLFSVSYCISAVSLFIFLRKSNQFHFVRGPSTVTRRLKKRMISFGSFIFGAHFLNLIARTIDTFILASVSEGGLADTAIFTIATYVVTIMEIPQRSLNSVTIPILAQAWKDKNLTVIESIYKKSVSNLLLIGLALLGLFYLNSKSLELFLGDDFSGVGFAILILGLGKLVDLGTGANTQIIGTSSYWKVDFFTNILYTLVALPLNYILISRYGLEGAAYSSLLSLSFYNLLRFSFLYFKFKLQPFTVLNLLAVLITTVCVAAAYIVPHFDNYILDALIRSSVFAGLFVPLVYRFKISSEINDMVNKLLKNIKSRLH